MGSLILSFLGIIIVFGTIKIIINIDKDYSLELSVKEKQVLGILIIVTNALLYLKFYGQIEYLFYYYLTLYLIITGYIDYKIKQVYCILNYITMGIAVIFMIYQVYIGIDITLIIGSLVIYIVLTNLFSLFRCYAGGDNEIYIAIGYFIASISYNSFPLYFLILNMLGASMVLVLLNLSKLIKNNKNNKIAFAPSIAIATILNILII